MRSTKIVATLGPASSDALVLERMIVAGVDVVRFNFSHGSAEDHLKRAELVREAAAKLGREVAIMADLQGPKIRVGKFADGQASRCRPGSSSFSMPSASSATPRRVGPRLQGPAAGSQRRRRAAAERRADHARRRARGRTARSHTRSRMGGELSNNKGINKPGGGLTAPALTAKDMDDIEDGGDACEADYLAVSFPRTGRHVHGAPAAARSPAKSTGAADREDRACGSDSACCAEIIDASDGIMVARGDLAVEVGNAAVPALQKRMIRWRATATS